MEGKHTVTARQQLCSRQHEGILYGSTPSKLWASNHQGIAALNHHCPRQGVVLSKRLIFGHYRARADTIRQNPRQGGLGFEPGRITRQTGHLLADASLQMQVVASTQTFTPNALYLRVPSGRQCKSVMDACCLQAHRSARRHEAEKAAARADVSCEHEHKPAGPECWTLQATAPCPHRHRRGPAPGPLAEEGSWDHEAVAAAGQASAPAARLLGQRQHLHHPLPAGLAPAAAAGWQRAPDQPWQAGASPDAVLPNQPFRCWPSGWPGCELQRSGWTGEKHLQQGRPASVKASNTLRCAVGLLGGQDVSCSALGGQGKSTCNRGDQHQSKLQHAALCSQPCVG